MRIDAVLLEVRCSECEKKFELTDNPFTDVVVCDDCWDALAENVETLEKKIEDLEAERDYYKEQMDAKNELVEQEMNELKETIQEIKEEVAYWKGDQK